MSNILGVSQGTVVRFKWENRQISFFVANPKDSIQRHHLSGEFYEQEELSIISKHWRADGAFVDIGANVGNHTVFVSKFLETPKLIVFEPNPPAVTILQLNLLLNQCDRVDRNFLGLALGSVEGLVNMVPDPVHHDNLGGNSTMPDPQGEVVVVAGDTLLAHERVAFLKIDIEGMELDVLHGLRQTITRWRPNIFIEVRDKNVDTFNRWALEAGYRVVETFARYMNVKNYMLVYGG